MNTFLEKYKSFKEVGGEAPVLYKDFQIKVKTNENNKIVVLIRDEKDRGGESINMDGMVLRSWVKENGIPMIDSHDRFTSVTEKALGALRNPRLEDVEGSKALVCDPDFAPTPNGNIAEILYLGKEGGKPYLTNVSIGMAVYDYDNEARRVLEWEPYEGSLVVVGAVMGARFKDKDETKSFDGEKTAKDLARFEQIKSPFKEFTKTFLSDSFCEKIGYTKDGDMLVDIANIYDIIVSKFGVMEAPDHVEAPKEPQLASQESVKALEALLEAQMSKF